MYLAGILIGTEYEQALGNNQKWREDDRSNGHGHDDGAYSILVQHSIISSRLLYELS